MVTHSTHKIVSQPIESHSVSIQLPGSKSESNRLLVLAALSGFKGEIKGLSDARDTRILKEQLNKVLAGNQELVVLDCMDGGAPLRFLMTVASLIPGKYLLTGTPRLMARPQNDLVACLKKMGVPIVALSETPGQGPWEIQGGKINQTFWEISVSTSSQYASALFLIAPFLGKPVTIELKGEMVSVPYIQLTCSALEKMGVSYVKRSDRIYEFKPEVNVPKELRVEADWSAAPYFLAAAECKGVPAIHFPNLRLKSCQGDSFTRTVFQYEGWVAEEPVDGHGLLFKKIPRSWEVKSLTLNLLNYPDLAPPLVTYYFMQNREVRFYGLETLSGKESVRDAVLGEMISQCGGNWNVKEACWVVSGNEPRKPELLNTHADHRMVMSFTLLSIIFGEIELTETESVEKSFPQFWREIAKLGIHLE